MKRVAAAAFAATLLLAVSACDDTEEKPGGQENTPPPPPPKPALAVPDAFATDQQPLPVIEDYAEETKISPDGTRMAYLVKSGQMLAVGQVDLTNGTDADMGHAEVPLIGSSDDGSLSGGETEAPSDTSTSAINSSEPILMFSGTTPVVYQSGALSGDPDIPGDSTYGFSFTIIGEPGSDPKVVDQVVEDGYEATLSDYGPIVSVSQHGGSVEDVWALDVESGEMKRHRPESDTVTSPKCGTGNPCEVPSWPEVQQGSTTVYAYQEKNGDVTGFGTNDWTSQDPSLVPKGAKPTTGKVEGVGNGVVVGRWEGRDGGTVYRTIDIENPKSKHGVATCDDTDPQGRTATTSPSGQYMTLGRLLFDLEGGAGACITEENYQLFGVDDSGTAWGSAQSAHTYSKEVGTFTIDGTPQPAGNDVAVPLTFVGIHGFNVGVFAISDNGQAVITGYPLA